MATSAAGATAATKMKATTGLSSSSSGFLSGGGADLGPPARKPPTGTDQDELDMFLSEITVQFDDEVQTLYVGPVEIVDDDEKSGKKGTAPSKGTSGAAAGPAKIQQKDDVTKTVAAAASATKASKDANGAAAAATTRKTKQAEENASEAGGKAAGGGDSGGADEGVAKAQEVDSANDGRLHRLTEAPPPAAVSASSSVVIDPKNGENPQTEKDLIAPTPEKTPTKATPIALPAKPTAIISPSTKRKSPTQQEDPPVPRNATTGTSSHQSQRISKRLKLTQPIKEESKPVLPVLVAEKTEQEDRTEPVSQTDEEDIPPPEGELIVPDVLPGQPQEEEEQIVYEVVVVPYDKDSSPAGSDSGIENEGAEQLGKVAVLAGSLQAAQEEETVGEEHIPEDLTEEEQGEAESENTQQEEKGPGGEGAPGKGSVIKCAKCVMSFKHVLWYKKHLMNYHGIDLSNIAHFLSNLQTLDEGIQGGQDEVEEEYADFQLEKSGQEEEDRGEEEENETEKTENGEEYQQQQQLEADGIARLRQEVTPSTPSPNTMQMYPEVKLSTSGKPKQQQQVRRRKEKLVPINADADMKIKHEYVTSSPASSTMVQSDESASGSQPLIDNVFVVKYLEQAAFMAGAPNSNALLGLPDGRVNKENSKLADPLATEGSEDTDGLTPYERAKIVTMHADDGPQFTCTVCEAVFDERQTAQDHVNFVHKDVKRRSCPHCGRTFTQTGDLTRHVRIHTGIRPFKCPFEGCTFAFISSGDLHKHVRRHQQHVPKPHVCGTCGKDFERNYDLKRHSSMHAMDDPNFTGFSCELCGKVFARKDQYRAHTYRHIGYKPYKCAHCGKTFSDSSNYAKHQKIHEMDGLILICDHCNKPFKNKIGISKHVLHCKYKHQKQQQPQAGGPSPRKKFVKKESTSSIEIGETSLQDC